MMRALVTAVAVLAAAGASTARAAVKQEVVKYKVGEQEFEGLLAHDPAVKGRRPGVLVVHEWWGLNDYARMRAAKLVELGYVALALDMYGGGRSTTHPREAGEMAQAVAKDPEGARARFLAGMELLRAHPAVDPQRIAAIGYCFGGTTVLEMARHGVDLRGVVSFHGSLAPVNPDPKRELKARVLVCHGADDPMVTSEAVNAFIEEMRKAGADWQLNVYGGARHSFTNHEADKVGIDGLGYSPSADRRSWQAMRAFLDEVFAK